MKIFILGYYIQRLSSSSGSNSGSSSSSSSSDNSSSTSKVGMDLGLVDNHIPV